jgi:hypothetical protein
MTPQVPDLLEVIDPRGLRELGYTRSSVDHLFAALPRVTLPGHRKVYLLRRDVAGYLEQHTRWPETRGGVTTHR